MILSGVCGLDACKYFWSCHGSHSRLKILFKQSLSECVCVCECVGRGERWRHCIISAPMRASVTTHTTHSANTGATKGEERSGGEKRSAAKNSSVECG